MSVRNGFTIEIYGFICVVYVPLARAAHDAARRLRSRARKIEDDARKSPDVRKTVNCSTKG